MADVPPPPRLDPERWRAASPHLDALLDVPNGARRAYLDTLRREHPQVADDVAAMLASHEAAAKDGFLETAPPTPPGASPGAGAIVGSYRLRSLIGHGGMGSVWLADRADGRFEGQAAVKLLNSRFMDAAGERRFRREGTILARLTHPHIGRLIDAGVTDTGRPYLVLEHIEGLHIDDYVRQTRPGVDATLRLMLDVLSAVGLAHTNLIVHRDLKPSNVLVTSTGEVKLLDFGIATLLQPGGTDATDASRTRDPGGLTPRYASPEQMLGQPITTATDVYALGVLLYGLLSGRHPGGDATAPADLLKAIVETNPPPVSSVAEPGHRKRLSGDVDRIVAKAMAKVPDERYRTVEAFADDIRRFLRHEPVSARPDTVTYRLRRFGRRHRRALAVVGTALAVIIALTSVYAIQLRRERDRAALAAQKAQRASDLLTSLFRGADPFRTPDPYGEGPTALALLDAGAVRVDTELADQPSLRAEMLSVIGRVYQRMGRADRAQPLLERAVEVGRTLQAEDGATLALALNDLGVLVREAGDLPRGRALLEESLALRRRHLGPVHADVAITLIEYARVLQDLGLVDESEAPIRESLEIRRAVFGDQHRETATSMSDLAHLLRDRGELREAEHLFRLSLETSRAVLPADHPNVAIGQANLALVLASTGHLEEAEALLQDSIAMQTRTMGASHVGVAQTLQNLSGVLLDLGRVRDARDAAERAVAIGTAEWTPDHPRLATFQLTLGRALLADNRADQALPLLEHALAVRRRKLTGADWRIGQAEALLGAALLAVNRPGDAEPLLRSASLRLRDVPGPQGRDRADNEQRLSRLTGPRR